MGGYGALSTALSACSIVYNPLVQASLQGVGRVVAQAEHDREQALRRTLRVHAAIALVFSCVFFLVAPTLAKAIGAPHLSKTLRLLSCVLLVYGLYAPLIGAFNGQGRLHLQAFFDVLSAALRSVGLVVGACFGYHFTNGTSEGGAFGASLGFCLSSSLVLIVAAFVAGVVRTGGLPEPVQAELSQSERDQAELSQAERGQLEQSQAKSSLPSAAEYTRRLLPLLLGHLLLNLLFQADGLLVRRFAASAAVAAGFSELAADPYVGAYRAAQLFSFLPYQLLSSITLVLFPILARAQVRGGKAEVAHYVAQGSRLALVLLGAMLSALVAFPSALVRLVYGADAALLGGPTLAVLGPCLGLLALLGLITSCLNGLGHERKTFLAVAVAVGSVLAISTLATRGVPLGPELLIRTALGTGVGLLAATLLAGLFLYREVGPWLRLGTLCKVTLGILGAGLLGRSFAPERALAVLWLGPVVLALYVGVLVATGELKYREMREFLARPRPKR